MQHSEITESEIHYHIRWSDSTIDWKTFASKEEATEHARRIKKPNESYTIVERDAQCERCKLFKSAATSQTPSLKSKQ